MKLGHRLETVLGSALLAGFRMQSWPRSLRTGAALGSLVRRLGIRRGDRVATLSWNHYRHLEAYFAVPCMGAIVHPLNLRLSPSDLAYIVNHAEDKIIIVDELLLPFLKNSKRG